MYIQVYARTAWTSEREGFLAETDNFRMGMDQPQDVQSLVERGDKLLIEGRVNDAVALYSRALEIDQNSVGAHLGVAKSYLALGSYGYVYLACRKVQELAPGTGQAMIAHAITLVLEQRYDAAAKELDRVEQMEPGQAYVHALRGYCYRRLGNSYDAMSAESKAARLSGNRNWAHLFPKVVGLPVAAVGLAPGGAPAIPSASATTAAPPRPPLGRPTTGSGPGSDTPSVPGPPPPPRPWNERANLDRQMVRARFALRDRSVVTVSLVTINIAIYLICALISHNFVQPAPAGQGDTLAMLNNPLYLHGDLVGALIPHDPVQAYRIFTSMFLHENWIHIGLNMWSLYILGTVTERIFGSGRYAALYFISGIIAGIVQAVAQPNVASLGASGAIFGVFGAFGAFVWLRRRQLGRAGSSLISQWVILIVINFAIDIPNASKIAVWDHVGGVVSGLVLGAIFVMTSNRRRTREAKV